ncbi:hypothetical protein [Priestia abyssalis]|uniref:hypothetical protein n=1 Tax=Priestia abyssalis TaxID=1221450 RepID=UPI0009955BE6|nr:hypothetical protein [Priestia abyssalis]
MKKKIELALQKDQKNAPRLSTRIHYPYSNANIDELIQEQLSELLIHKEEAANQKGELENKLREIQKEYARMELKHQEKFEIIQEGLEQTHASMHTVNQQSEANYESIKSLQEKLDGMISELNETKHQFTLSKNNLQSCLKIFHDANIRMDEIEKNLSKVTDYFNEQKKEQRKEKKKELSIRKTNKEAERKDKEV